MKQEPELLFHKYDLRALIEQHKQKLFGAIQALDSKTLLNTSVEELAGDLLREYRIDVPKFQIEGISVSQEVAQIDVRHDFNRAIFDRSKPFCIEGTRFSFFVPFTGDKELFRCQPSTFTTTLPRAFIGTNELTFIYEMADPSPSAVRAMFDRGLAEVTKHLTWVENDVTEFNRSIERAARERIDSRRRRVLDVKGIVADLGFPIRQESEEAKAESPQRTSTESNHDKAERAQAESPRRLKVFLCHSSDDKPSVRALYDKLRLSAAYIVPWLDEDELLPGQNWKQVITAEVRNSDIVMACLSHGSVNKKGFVQSEIKLALDLADEQPEGSIYLIPVRLEKCDLPNRLNHLQCVNLFEEKGFDRLMRALKLRAESIGIGTNS
jgi:hypothetical protein